MLTEFQNWVAVRDCAGEDRQKLRIFADFRGNSRRMSSDFEILGSDEEYALVVALSKARDCFACVSCLKLRGLTDIHVMGDPFRLLDREWGDKWENQRLRDLGIDFGSIIVVDQLCKLVRNTGKKMVSFVFV